MVIITRSQKIMVAGVCSLASVFLFAGSALAAVPTLSANLSGSGDNVLLIVNGDANSNVILNYLGSSQTVQMSALGTTNSSGQYQQTLSTSQYSISPGSLFYVTVNNQRSASATWPYTTSISSTVGTITLSQTNLSLSIGQSSTINAINNTGGALFLSSNTSPSVANITLSGNQIGITGNIGGGTSVTVCSLSNTSICATIAVNVQSANVQPVAFSQSNVTLGYGQNLTITVAGGTGTYTISSNSNPTIIQASLTGSNVYLYASANSGVATITVCSTNLSSCGAITVTASATNTSSPIMFSPTNPSMTPGNIVPVTISGGTDAYYVSSNTNTVAVQTNIVASTLTLYGNSVGTATLSLCSSSGACGTLFVTVNAQGTSQLALGQTNVTFAQGQSANVAVSGLGGFYVSTNTNPTVASAIVNGSAVVITSASNAGTTNVTVCQSDNQCKVIYVTVTSAAATTNATTATTATTITTTQVVSVGQGINLMLAGGATPYSVTSYPANIVTTKVTGDSVLTINGVGTGTAAVNICSNNGGCITVNVIAVGSASATSAVRYKFASPLKVGSVGAEVRELQKRLTEEGVYTGTITGTFGPATEAAVKIYQREHNLTQLGSVGPGTRSALNAQ